MKKSPTAEKSPSIPLYERGKFITKRVFEEVRIRRKRFE
jgi:hypothetical protein